MSTVTIRIYTYTDKTGRWNSCSSKGTITCFRPDLTAEVRRTVYLVCASINYSIFRFGRFWRETAQERPDTDGLAEQPQAYLLAYSSVDEATAVGYPVSLNWRRSSSVSPEGF